ncbi:MAG: hypothetical protein NC920_02815 [Candidatus Omnitrophica bacterium]|nr:hypothetical protein [Candidatus Omnitrophota bacterium]
MEKGTSISKESLTQLAKRIKEEYKVTIWFAEILGNRWSYLTGEREISGYLSEKIQLNERLGVVVNNGVKISHEEKEDIINLIKKEIVPEVKL